MTVVDLLKDTLDVNFGDVRKNEHTPTPVRMFGVYLQSMGVSYREVAIVLGCLVVDRSRGAVWNWTNLLSETQKDPTTKPSQIAIDEMQSTLMVKQNDSMLRSTRSPHFCWGPTFTDVAGSILWRHSSTDSLKNTTSPKSYF